MATRVGCTRCAASILAGLVALSLMACDSKDRRISIEEFRQLESSTPVAQPVDLDTTGLELTELRPYTVSPGDVLSLSMTGIETGTTPTGPAPVRARVHEDGTIMLPMVGKLKVAGMTLEQIEQELYRTYVPNFVKSLSVFAELANPENTTVLVVGAATAQGLVTLPINERNVLYALARAGGFGTQSSGLVRVRPIRPERPEQTFDLNEMNDVRRALVSPPLQSGDLVFVEPRELSQIYMVGLLNVPGPVSLPPDGSLSLMRAISAAGGLRDFLDPQEATLWRRLPDGSQARVKLDLASIRSGSSEDVELLPGDILDVPHTAHTRIREWAAANIRIGPFGVGAYFDPVTYYTFKDDTDDDDNGGGFRRALGDTVRFGLPNAVIPPVRTAGQ